MKKAGISVLAVALCASPVLAENLVQNATFDTTISPWTQETGTVNFDGAVGQLPGSMRLIPAAGSTAMARSECITLPVGNLPFDLSGDFLVDTANSRIVLGVWFFPNNDCTFSGATGRSTNNAVGTPGTWFVKSTAGTVPGGTQSLLVDITVSPTASDALIAHADNIVLDIDLPQGVPATTKGVAALMPVLLAGLGILGVRRALSV